MIILTVKYGVFVMALTDIIVTIVAVILNSTVNKKLFNSSEDTEELENSENTALPAPVVSEPEKTEAPAPESVVITCEKCGQTMLIPSGSGAVKVTCPKCGSDIIYTYDS